MHYSGMAHHAQIQLYRFDQMCYNWPVADEGDVCSLATQLEEGSYGTDTP